MIIVKIIIFLILGVIAGVILSSETDDAELRKKRTERFLEKKKVPINL